MRKDDAKRRIRELYFEWRRTAPKPTVNWPLRGVYMDFFPYLEQHHPSLLTFRSAADKWHVVKGWAINWEEEAERWDALANSS